MALLFFASLLWSLSFALIGANDINPNLLTAARLGLAFIAPVVVFVALICGAVAALAWPGPPVRKDKKD